MENNIEVIKRNNETINEIIRNIIKNRKGSIAKKDENGNYIIDETYKKIVVMEVTKLLKIYQAEFPFLEYDMPQNVAVDIVEGNGPDGRGYKEGVAIVGRTFEALSSLKTPYFIDSSGRIIFDENTNNTEKIKCNLYNQNDGVPFLLNEDERIQNNVTTDQYFTYCYLNDYSDIDFLLDILPHETMHMFGFKGGAYEGVTEEFSRELSKKYNLRTVPIAHQEETITMQKIEKIIGKKKLANFSFTREGQKENHEEISSSIDEAFKSGEKMQDDDFGLYLEYVSADDEFFKFVKSKKRSEMTDEEKQQLDALWKKVKSSRIGLEEALKKYVANNEEKLHSFEEDQLNDDEIEIRNNRYDEAVKFQQEEIRELELLLIKEKVKQIQEFEQMNKQVEQQNRDNKENCTYK